MTRRCTPILLLAALLAGCQAAPEPHGKLYVSNVVNGTVTILDPVGARTLKKLQVGALPHNFVFTPDKRFLLLTNTGSQNLSVIDTKLDEVVKEVLVAPIPHNKFHDRIPNLQRFTSCKTCHIDPRGTLPAGISREPDGSYLVASLNGPTLTRLDAKTFQPELTRVLHYPVQDHCSNVLHHPSRHEIYVLNRSLFKRPGMLTVLDDQFREKRHFPVIKQPYGMLVSEDGNELFIASRATNKVQVWDTRAWKLKRVLHTGDGPVGLFLSENGKLYTGNFYTNRPSFISVLDANTGTTLKQIECRADITQITTDPSRRFMYVCNSGANVVQVVDLQTDEIIRDLAGGPFPLDAAFLPD